MNSKLKVAISSQISDTNSQSEEFILNSVADPLFNSTVWLKAWWQRWGRDFELNITSLKSREGIVCKLSLYIDPFKFKNILLIKRLQFIGTNYQSITTPRAEYLAFSIIKGYENSIILALDALKNLKWDEFVARDIVKDDYTDLAIKKWAKDSNWAIRIIHTDTAYSINTTTSFEGYKINLGPNTRLKLINRRKLLEKQGDVFIENYYPNRIDDFFDLMNEFHQKRWGDSFSEKTISFHKEIMKSSKPGGLDVELSVLTVNGVCESVIFNYVLGGKVYNINSGFNENFNKKIAIGMLHFGFMIESAFLSPDIDVFDFLAGSGKNANYKSRLATDTLDLHSLQIVRSPWLRVLYYFNKGLKKLRGFLFPR